MKKLYMFFTIVFLSVMLISCEEFIRNGNDTFLFTLENFENQVLIEENITFDGISIFTSIKNSVELDYEEFPFGILINGIDNNYPKEYGVTYNYYYALYVNNTFSNTGISELLYEDNLKISFKEETMLSKLDLLVDQIIYNLTSKIDTTKTIDYLLLQSLIQASIYNYDFVNLSNYEQETNLTNVGDALKSLIYNNLNNELTEIEKNDVKNLTYNNSYAAFSYLNILTILNADEESKLIVANSIINDKYLYVDADTAASTLLTFSSFANNIDVKDFVSDMEEVILNNITKDGINSWGGANLSATAQVLLAVLALGKEVDYFNQINLVEAIVKFYDEEGFKNNLTGNVDLMFATPQGLSSLIMYKIVRDQLSYNENKSLNIFEIK